MVKFRRLMIGEPAKSLSVQCKFPVFAAEFLNRIGGNTLLSRHGYGIILRNVLKIQKGGTSNVLPDEQGCHCGIISGRA